MKFTCIIPDEIKKQKEKKKTEVFQCAILKTSAHGKESEKEKRVFLSMNFHEPVLFDCQRITIDFAVGRNFQSDICRCVSWVVQPAYAMKFLILYTYFLFYSVLKDFKMI